VFDLIVVDMMLPTEAIVPADEAAGGTLTGVYLIQHAKRKRPNVPILVLSVRRDTEVGRALSHVQIHGQLTKPVMPQDFLEAIMTALKEIRDDDV
jgi:DNA-binding NarL/FixJ family response regulator